MPITAELENINKFESAGFDHNQAKTLAEVIEKSHHDSHQDLKEFIHNEINGLELRMKASQSDLLMKIFGIIVGTVGIAVTVLKLF